MIVSGLIRVVIGLPAVFDYLFDELKAGVVVFCVDNGVALLGGDIDAHLVTFAVCGSELGGDLGAECIF